MSRIMLIAGNLTNELAEYLEDKQTIDVKYRYASLNKNHEQIINNIIDIDKLVILDNFESHSFMIGDMETLQKLLGSNFFKCKEIIYLGRDYNERYLEFFEFYMGECNYDNYSVYIDSKFSYTNIYNYILGLDKKQEELSNVYQSVYRVRKHSKQDKIYDIDLEQGNLQIEPFNYRNVIEYFDYQKRLRLTQPDEIILDRETGLNIDQKIMASFEDLEELEIKLVTKKNFILITGERKSGTTVMLICLATSAANNGKKVLTIDLKDNRSTSTTLEMLEVEKNVLHLEDLKHNNLEAFYEFLAKAEDFNLNILSSRGYKGDNINELIEYLLSNVPDDLFDVIFVDYPIQKYQSYVKLFLRASHLVITTSLRLTDINSMLELLSIVKKEHLNEKRKLIIPVSIFKRDFDTGYVTHEQMSELLREHLVRFVAVSGFNITNLNIEGHIYSDLFGGTRVHA